MSRFSTTKLFHQGLLEIFIIHKINERVDCTAKEVHTETEMIKITRLIDFKSKMKIKVKNANSCVTNNKEKRYYKKSFDEVISGQFKLYFLCIFTTHVGSNACPDDP